MYGLLLSVAMFVSAFFLVYHQADNSYTSDTFPHIVFLYKYFYGTEPFYIPHPLWHLGTLTTAKILHISIENAAAFFSAMMVVWWSILVYVVVMKSLKNMPPKFILLITVSILFIGPLCIPWYHKLVFWGQGSPNIWHNVTLWAVKPFALLGMLYIIKAIKSDRTHDYIMGLLFVVISIFAKPSFIIMFLPALLLFAWLKKIYTSKFIRFYLILSVISIAILLYQYAHTFNTADSHIVFDFGGVWSVTSTNIPISILLGLAFPLLLLVIYPESIRDDYLLLSWLQILIGLCYAMCLAQSGKYYSHGNFMWSYVLAMSLLYLFSIVKFFQVIHLISPVRRYLLLALLAIQTLTGLYYFIRVIQGINPLYVTLM